MTIVVKTLTPAEIQTATFLANRIAGAATAQSLATSSSSLPHSMARAMTGTTCRYPVIP